MVDFSPTFCLAISLPPTHDVISYRNKTFTFVACEYVIESVFLEFVIRRSLNDVGVDVFAHYFSNLLHFLGKTTSGSVILFE